MEQKSTKALKKNSMSLLGIVVLVYAFIAAGAFGIEEAIASSGPGVTLAMLLIFPFVWSIPLGRMVHGTGRRRRRLCRCADPVCRKLGGRALRYRRDLRELRDLLFLHRARFQSVLRHGGRRHVPQIHEKGG